MKGTKENPRKDTPLSLLALCSVLFFPDKAIHLNASYPLYVHLIRVCVDSIKAAPEGETKVAAPKSLRRFRPERLAAGRGCSLWRPRGVAEEWPLWSNGSVLGTS